MDRLKREANPPVGQLASPIPQYKKPGSTDYEAVEGQHGAPFATLKDASGNVVSPATEAKLEQVRVLLNSINSKDFATDAKLEQARVLLNSINSKDFATNAKLEEVRALLNTINGKDFATQAELVAVKQELQAIKNSLTDGTQKVTLSGAVEVEVLQADLMLIEPGQSFKTKSILWNNSKFKTIRIVGRIPDSDRLKIDWYGSRTDGGTTVTVAQGVMQNIERTTTANGMFFTELLPALGVYGFAILRNDGETALYVRSLAFVKEV